MRRNRNRKTESGFNLVELMVAVMVLMVGVVAVAQMVPAAMRTNLANRYDSTAVVIAQRVMEVLLDQPINAWTVQADPFEPQISGAYAPQTFNLGNPAPPGGLVPWTISGSNWWPAAYVTATGNIDWTQNPVANYNLQGVVDPTDATRQPYEVRWAVDTRWGLVAGVTPTAVSKRIVVSVRRMDPSSQLVPPTSLTIVRTNGTM